MAGSDGRVNASLLKPLMGGAALMDTPIADRAASLVITANSGRYRGFVMNGHSELQILKTGSYILYTPLCMGCHNIRRSLLEMGVSHIPLITPTHVSLSAM